jgi:hypothetical protein
MPVTMLELQFMAVKRLTLPTCVISTHKVRDNVSFYASLSAVKRPKPALQRMRFRLQRWLRQLPCLRTTSQGTENCLRRQEGKSTGKPVGRLHPSPLRIVGLEGVSCSPSGCPRLKKKEWTACQGHEWCHNTSQHHRANLIHSKSSTFPSSHHHMHGQHSLFTHTLTA